MVKRLGLLAARIWAIWLLLHFMLFLILFYPLFRLFLSKEKYYPKAHALRKIWGRYILSMAGMYTKVEFEVPLPKNQKFVLVSNHSSYLDIPAITVMTPLYFNFMAKDELRKVPVFGIFFSTIDIAVQRKNAVAAHKAFKKAGERLERGTSMCLFPEGTITASAPKLGRFKDGAFRLAIEHRVPILPITLPDNYKRLPDGKLLCTPGKIRMFVHRPISVDHLNIEDRDRLKQEVFCIIEEKLREYESIN